MKPLDLGPPSFQNCEPNKFLLFISCSICDILLESQQYRLRCHAVVCVLLCIRFIWWGIYSDVLPINFIYLFKFLNLNCCIFWIPFFYHLGVLCVFSHSLWVTYSFIEQKFSVLVRSTLVPLWIVLLVLYLNCQHQAPLTMSSSFLLMLSFRRFFSFVTLNPDMWTSLD